MSSLLGKAEVHFHTQEEISLFTGTTATNCRDSIEIELQLLASFALRQMMNLGPTEVTASLATVLGSIDDSTLHAPRQEDVRPRLCAYPGVRGRKRFELSIELKEKFVKSKLKARGFGFLATGIGYYAPTSAMALLKHLSLLRHDDAEFRSLLCDVAQMTGAAVLSNQVNLTSQHSVSRWIVTTALSGATELHHS